MRYFVYCKYKLRELESICGIKEEKSLNKIMLHVISRLHRLREYHKLNVKVRG